MDFDSAVALLDRPELFADDGAPLYRSLAKALHPDRVPHERVAEATAAFARLSALWTAAQGVTITSRTGSYRVGDPVGSDGLADYFETGDVVLKVARHPTDNDLFAREARVVRQVWRRSPQKFKPYVPKLHDSFVYRDASSGVDRAVNVFRAVPGLVSLAHLPSPVDGRDAAWMWRRLLVALGVAHRAGVIHGAVVPDHVLIEPAEHGLVLINWCYASAEPSAGPDGPAPQASRNTVPALVRRYRDWYAPEIASRVPPTPGSDIYLATRCMVALMGDRVPEALARFARGCLAASPAARPDDAWQLLAELDDVLGHIYGPRRFRPFALPATVPAWPRQGR